MAALKLKPSTYLLPPLPPSPISPLRSRIPQPTRTRQPRSPSLLSSFTSPRTIPAPTVRTIPAPIVLSSLPSSLPPIPSALIPTRSSGLSPTSLISGLVSTSVSHAPSITVERSYGPSTTSERSYGPSVISERSYGPSVISERSYGPSVTSERAPIKSGILPSLTSPTSSRSTTSSRPPRSTRELLDRRTDLSQFVTGIILSLNLGKSKNINFLKKAKNAVNKYFKTHTVDKIYEKSTIIAIIQDLYMRLYSVPLDNNVLLISCGTECEKGFFENKLVELIGERHIEDDRTLESGLAKRNRYSLVLSTSALQPVSSISYGQALNTLRDLLPIEIVVPSVSTSSAPLTTSISSSIPPGLESKISIPSTSATTIPSTATTTTPITSATTTAPKQTMCGYEVKEIIGEGTFGKVYLVSDSNNVLHALKVPIYKSYEEKRGTGYSNGPIDSETLSEIANQIYVKYPYSINIERILNCPTNYISVLMPYYPSDLYKLMYSTKWINLLTSETSPSTAKRAEQVGLKYLIFKFAHDILCQINNMHEKSIMHLDIKPSNILISRDGNALLGDYGLSQTKYGKRYREPNGIITLPYRGPELTCEFNENYGPEVDIWSYGILLYELFFGVNPYGTDHVLTQSRNILDSIAVARDYEAKIKNKIDNPYSAFCAAIIHAHNQHNIIIPTSLENILDLKTFFSKYFYTPREYRDIWQVINSSLQIDPERRASAAELLRMPLFTHLDSKCPKIIVKGETKELKGSEVKESAKDRLSRYIEDLASSIITRFISNLAVDELKGINSKYLYNAALDLAHRVINKDSILKNDGSVDEDNIINLENRIDSVLNYDLLDGFVF